MRHLSVSPPRFEKPKFGGRFFDAFFLDHSVLWVLACVSKQDAK